MQRIVRVLIAHSAPTTQVGARNQEWLKPLSCAGARRTMPGTMLTAAVADIQLAR
jgi:hypothetical protein